MPAPLETLQAKLAESRTVFLSATREVDPARAVWKKDAATWSVAEVAEHLLLVERGVVDLLDRSLFQLGAAPRKPSTYELSELLKGVDLANDPRRVDAPSFVVPTHHLSLERSVEGLQFTRLRLSQILTDADGLPLETSGAPHPFFGTLNLYEWLLFLSQHELRHSNQIVRTKEAGVAQMG